MPAQPRVLMVEDHPDIADLYQLKLQLEGYRVAVAADGVSGLRMARTFKPLSETQIVALLAKTKEAAQNGEFEGYKTTTNFDGTAHNPQWLG